MDVQASFSLNTGAKIPAVGLGTWQTDGASCKVAVSTALGVGYRHLDCAHLYGNEIEVGQALADALGGGIPGLKREDLFVTSKLWCTTNASKRVEISVDISLKNLGMTYLDLYLVHWPDVSSLADATDPPPMASGDPSKFLRRMKYTWLAMESLVEKGKAAAIGVSNFSIPQLEELLTFANIVPAVNQAPFVETESVVRFQIFNYAGLRRSVFKGIRSLRLGNQHKYDETMKLLEKFLLPMISKEMIEPR